jgi:hypothetical protein
LPQVTVEPAPQLQSVTKPDNTTPFWIKTTAVDVVHAHQVTDMLSELTDKDVTEQDFNVTAFQDSIPELGNVSDAELEAEDQPIKILVNQFNHVPDQTNTTVFGIPKTVVHVLHAHLVKATLLEPIEPAVIDKERSVTASQDLMKVSGTVLDAKMVLLEQETEALVLPLPHVADQDNTMDNITPRTVEDVPLAQISQVTSSEPIEPVVIESESNATASQDSMKDHGIASDADSEAEDQPIKEHASQFNHVPDQTNTMVSGIPKTVVLVPHAQQVTVTSLEPIEPVVTESERIATASQDSTPKSGTVLDAKTELEPQLIMVLVNQCQLVTNQDNILESMTLNHADNADYAHKNQDT